MIIQIVEAGVCVDAKVIQDGAAVTTAKATWPGGEFDAPAGATLMAQSDAGIGWTLSGSKLVEPSPPAPTKDDLLSYAAAKRWTVETGGITVNGASIDTSRDSQAMIANAYAYVTSSGAASISYKASSGWVTMDAATVKAVALAVGAHVQAAFASEQTVDAAIEAGTIATYAAVDAASWPA